MPTISMFYGLIIRMYYFGNQQHNMPHIHVEYQDHKAVNDTLFLLSVVSEN